MHFEARYISVFFAMFYCIISADNVTNHDSEDLNQRGCRIPNLELLSDDVKKFYRKEPDLVCENRASQNTSKVYRPALFTEDTQFLYFNASALSFYESTEIKCIYRSFKKEIGAEDGVRYLCENKLEMDRPNEILNEFIEVVCQNNASSEEIYRDYFAFFPRKIATEERCNIVNQHEKTQNNSLSVLVIGLDTISRLQFHRQFPRSSTFLQNQMNAVEMMGHNKVAENTYPNLVPLLSGLTAEQLNNTCLRDNDNLVDTCPIIWKKYHEKGFRTIFVEDAPDVAIFNWGAGGFKYQPTDYYLRPMYLEYEKNVGHEGIGCGSRCLGSRSSLSFLLNYAEKAAKIFRDEKYFGFHWSCSATHNTFNIPTQVDDTLENFLQTLMRENLLNNTLLVVMADHGFRMPSLSEFVNTPQGQCENRLPLLMLVFPNWFEKKYTTALANLRRNTHTLTSHFDLHRLFHDLMNLNNLETLNLQKREQEDREPGKGRSLFLPISINRTCPEAHIPLEFCACDCLNL